MQETMSQVSDGELICKNTEASTILSRSTSRVLPVMNTWRCSESVPVGNTSSELNPSWSLSVEFRLGDLGISTTIQLPPNMTSQELWLRM
jgi:hypothetical protein